MKPALLDIKSEGDLGGQKIAMTLDANSLAHIMAVLTDMYSDPMLACIREYSTNAFDAHVEAGNPASIEIESPNRLFPFFKVRDYGIGMSIDDIVNIYSRYGMSTKRNTDEQNGMLGIGCKSALTYTSQFTLIGTKDGIRTMVSISRTADGAGQMEIVDESLTDEPNGVEIVIPVHNSQVDSFNERIERFYSFWKPGSVLVDGKTPEYVFDHSERTVIDENTIVIPGRGEDVILMGNVPYPAKGLTADTYNKPYHVIARVEIGEVIFPPNREALQYTETTKAKIEEIRTKVDLELAKKAQADIEGKASNYIDAVGVWVDKWKRLLPGINVLHYKGHVLSDRVKFDGLIYVFEPDTNGRNTTRTDDVWYRHIEFIITGFNKTISSTDRRKIRAYLAQNDLDPRYILLLRSADPRLTEVTTVDWSEIRSIKLDTAKSPSGIKEFSVLSEFGHMNTVTELKDKEILYYMPGSTKPEVNKLSYLAKDYHIVKLPVPMEKKFKAQFPKAQLFRDFLKDKFEIAKASVSEADRIRHFNNNWYSKNSFAGLDPDRIDDPKLADYIRKTGNGKQSDEVRAYHRWMRYCAAMGISVTTIDTVSNPFVSQYPLIGQTTVESRHREHAYMYINAVYNNKENNGDSV